MSLTCNISVHRAESCALCLAKYTQDLCRYFFHIKSCQGPLSCSNFHHHLHIRLTLNLWRFLIPKPPLLLGEQITFHLTRWYLLFLWVLANKKDLTGFSIPSILVLCNSLRDIWYTALLDKQASILVTLPPIHIDPLIQPSIPCLIFSSTNFISATVVLLAHTGVPKYFIGQEPGWQLNNSV
jgi:hypothetical protein